MKATLSRHNQSGLSLDDESLKLIQTASRPDWNPLEQLVLIKIPNVSTDSSPDENQEVPQIGWTAEPKINLRANPANELKHESRLTSVADDLVRVLKPQRTVDVTRTVDSQPVADKVERTGEWISKPDTASTRRATGQSLGTENAMNLVAVEFIESVISRFEASASFVLMFCDVERASRCVDICMSAATLLAARTGRRAIVIDAEAESSTLSLKMGLDKTVGLRELLRTEMPLGSAVYPSDNPSLDVIPAGQVKLHAQSTASPFELKARGVIAQLRQTYGIICLSTGLAFDAGVLLFSPCCDGSYLSIDCEKSSRMLAKSSANQLRQCGARLLGCIAATSNENHQARKHMPCLTPSS
jgi:hypothetical protein